MSITYNLQVHLSNLPLVYGTVSENKKIIGVLGAVAVSKLFLVETEGADISEAKAFALGLGLGFQKI